MVSFILDFSIPLKNVEFHVLLFFNFLKEAEKKVVFLKFLNRCYLLLGGRRNMIFGLFSEEKRDWFCQFNAKVIKIYTLRVAKNWTASFRVILE